MSEEQSTPIEIDFFSDVLCIWAYIGCRRVVELGETFVGRVRIRTRFCSVFSDVPGKIADGWSDRGGYDGYARHAREVAAAFPHVELGEEAWRAVRPHSSAPAHLFLKAVQLAEGQAEGTDVEEAPYAHRSSTRAAWAVRTAFFSQSRDVSDWRVLQQVAEETGLDPAAIWDPHLQGRAAAALAKDFDLSRKLNVEGSPTFILNSGRQRLFGNVGYRVLEANVEELLRRPRADEVSWC